MLRKILDVDTEWLQRYITVNELPNNRKLTQMYKDKVAELKGKPTEKMVALFPLARKIYKNRLQNIELLERINAYGM